MFYNNIFDLSKNSLADWLFENNEPSFRTEQIWSGLYKQNYSDFSQFSSIPNPLKLKLQQNFTLCSLKPIDLLISKDKSTQKILFELLDGYLIETVLMKYDKRNSLCISTQSGCAMGCKFCATGQMGFHRNLTSGEIISQVLFFQNSMAEIDQKITNIVYMGMGEPFMNYENTMESIERLNDPQGFNLGLRRFTISTIGICPRIFEFADKNSQVNLAISLHATNDELRESIIPYNKKYKINDILNACDYYINKTNRRITIEYALINKINDKVSNAKELCNLIKGKLFHVNLISLNPTSKFPGQGSSKRTIEKFKETLISCGIPTSVRLRRGVEIQAGCGQLADQHFKMV